MIRFTMLMLAICCSSLAYSAEDDAAKAALKNDAKEQSVQEDLATPDGATMRLLDDGGWQIFGQGTATYDSTDPDEVLDAQKEATLKAKANIAKFLKEKVTSQETMEEVTKKSKKLSSDKEGASFNKESVKVTTTKLSSSAEEVLRGVIVLEMIKTPASKNGGTVTIKVGVSSKSQALAGKARAEINAPVGGSGVDGGTGNGGAGDPANTSERKKAKTDF